MQNVKGGGAALTEQREGTRSIDVVVVDDHPAIREAIADVIGGEEDIRLCGEAETAQEAKHVIARTQPRVVIVDVSLGRSNGLELVRHLHTRSPHLGIVVFSMHDETVYAKRALDAGAVGYVMKSAPIGRVIAAVRRAAQGKRYLSRRMTTRLDGSST